MAIKPSYIITVFSSLLILFIGHKIALSEPFLFQNVTHEILRARVQEVVARTGPEEVFEGFMPTLSERIIFEAAVTRGERRGEIVTAAQSLSGWVTPREVARGNVILLINVNDVWHFNGFVRTNRLLGLGLLFVLCVLFFGGKKGFNTILSLGLTFGAIFAVFIPSIFSGINIYLTAILVCVYVIATTLLLVIGFNKKALVAAIGCASGVAVSGIITVIMDRVLFLTGLVDDQSRFLLNLPVGYPINLRAIIFAGIIIGAMGAIMDVAMSISSSLWEVKEKARMISFKTLYRSGLNIGRDIMGSMANTLILAYTGSSLSVVLILSVFSNSLMTLFNSEMIIVEILKALVGSFGILAAMPLTAFFCGLFFTKKGK